MIDANSFTPTTRSTRRRTTKKVVKVEETINSELSNGSSYHINDSERDRSWSVMDYSDYVDYSRYGDGNTSLIDILFGNTLFGFRWDIVEDIHRKKSGIQDSKVPEEGEDGGKAPGYIFKYYKKFGYYWNVFPKTDYCYLPGSPYYKTEVSPGIPTVPNLSREPLPSYVRRGSSKVNLSHEKINTSETRQSFEKSPLMSSTTYEQNMSSNSIHSVHNNWNSGIESRKSLLNNHHYYNYRREGRSSSWRRVISLTKTILTVITKTTVSIVTSIAHLSSSLVTSSHSDGTRSCNWLPIFLFLLILLPLVYYLFPGVLGADHEELVTAVSSPASGFFSWSIDLINSGFNLVKESLLFIPTIYFQLLALLSTNSSSAIKSETPCPDGAAAMINTPPSLSLMNLSDLTEEKLAALQTEIAGQNHVLSAWIERLQEQLTNLTIEMKKLSSQVEGDKNAHYRKLEGELSELKKTLVGVTGNVLPPSDQMVERAVAKYHADRTGQADYALHSSGGHVVRVRCTQTYKKTSGYISLYGFPLLPWDMSKGPDTILKPGVLPGECWAFEGSCALITIQLGAKVRITSVSIEHTPKELTLLGHITSAPKDFSVWALENENDENPHLLGKFTFLDNGESLQQFYTNPNENAVDLVLLNIESNHGNPEYTCIYRVRVHGVPTMSLEAEGNSTETMVASRSRPRFD